MKLEHSFTVPAPVDHAWATLLDIEGVAPCFPGAALTGVDGDAFSGTVKLKLGPVSLTYSGKGRFLEKDEAAHRAVIEASGRDRNGNGTAGATVHAHLEADGADTTTVVVSTDLKVTGRPAQFGRGVIQDVGSRIVDQFAACLAQRMAASVGRAGTGGGDLTGDDDAAVAGAGGPDAVAASPQEAVAPVPSAVPSAGQPVPAEQAAPTERAAPLTLAASSPRTAAARPAAPRPAALRPVTDEPGTAAGTDEAEPAALDLGAAMLPVLLRRFGPPLLAALVSGLLGWWVVRRLRRR